MLKIIDFSTKTRALIKQERLAGENVMQQCLQVKQGEKVLVISDTLTEKIQAPIFFESAKIYTNRVKMVIIKPSGRPGIEPAKEVTKLMMESDVILAPTTFSITHTKARFLACKNGSRIATLPGITLDTILRTLTIDYNEIAILSKKITGLLTMAEKAELTSPSGTRMAFSLAGRDALADTGLIVNAGDYGNLPAGEGLIAPVEGKSNGILVFDACYGEQKLTGPIAFSVKDGLVTKALCQNDQVRQIETILNKLGPKARNIAELGVGTNKMAKPIGGILEIEKIYGTCHVALGNNAYFGGEVDIPYHDDGLIVNPTLKLDGKIIIKNGKFII